MVGLPEDDHVKPLGGFRYSLRGFLFASFWQTNQLGGQQYPFWAVIDFQEGRKKT